MKYSKDYTDVEMMIITAAKEIRDGEIVFVGTYWPLLVSMFAKLTHAPNIIMVYEGGVIRDTAPSRLPYIASDPCVADGAVLCGDSIDTLGMVLQRGLVDVGLLSAAYVDKHGNINNTFIGGDYRTPKVRLSGSGGSCDIASLAKRVLIILKHERRRFVEKVDYITSPGYVEGSKKRTDITVVTTLGVFRFDDVVKELVLDAYYPHTSIDDIRRNVGWDLKVTKKVKVLPPPTEHEIEILRQIDSKGFFLRG
jgi:glutaconate CoA-transferase subunit B